MPACRAAFDQLPGLKPGGGASIWEVEHLTRTETAHPVKAGAAKPRAYPLHRCFRRVRRPGYRRRSPSRSGFMIGTSSPRTWPLYSRTSLILAVLGAVLAVLALTSGAGASPHPNVTFDPKLPVHPLLQYGAQ